MIQLMKENVGNGLVCNIYKNSRLQANIRSDEFFHRIKDWFGQLKNQFYTKLFGEITTVAPPALSTDILDLDELQLKRKLQDREWLRVDLSTVTFDPDRDWGFRVGNWYFIRKELKNDNGFKKNNADDLDFQHRSQPTDPIGVKTEETSDDTTELEAMDSLSVMSTTTAFTTVDVMTQLMTQQADTHVTTQSNIQIDTSENPSSRTEQRIADNETNNDLLRRGSVEVLMG
ncbi:PREDICTED: uncharacterized protein LOC107195142 [Dufourea novaeangliae]|uniref:Uncharacterized protein n=1 Tax=Dufourea novaeangliae TaxID=178035 RepID=A0A154P4J1_DUFNO|nr:PREDICTED: uncharacterized protein LOC107195142 [Dufourea novaeangliae]KZC06869.1 hypothetical protein WN55_08965 [Dufourea novaeangliae]